MDKSRNETLNPVEDCLRMMKMANKSMGELISLLEDSSKANTVEELLTKRKPLEMLRKLSMSYLLMVEGFNGMLIAAPIDITTLPVSNETKEFFVTQKIKTVFDAFNLLPMSVDALQAKYNLPYKNACEVFTSLHEIMRFATSTQKLMGNKDGDSKRPLD